MFFLDIYKLNMFFTFVNIFIIFIIIKSLINIKYNNINFSKFEYNKYKSKINKLPLMLKLRYYILELEKIYNKEFFLLKPIKILIISTIISISAFFISYRSINIFSTSIIVSIFSFFIPYIIIKELIKNKKQEILNIFPTYLISLKNYTKVDNDILNALKMVDTRVPLCIYINRFNISNEKGINIFECFDRLKKDINISIINDFFNSVKYCYINGGDFTNLLEKFSKNLIKYNLQMEKEKEDGLGAKIVLYILILINLYIVFGFVLNNDEYKEIVVNNVIGKAIININLLSYLLMFFFMKKMEE